MNSKEKRIKLAFAIGKLMGSNVMVHLEEIDPELAGFTITTNGDNVALYWDGFFGKSKAFSRVLTLYDGWTLNHKLALIEQAIDMLQAEHRTA